MSRMHIDEFRSLTKKAQLPAATKRGIEQGMQQEATSTPSRRTTRRISRRAFVRGGAIAAGTVAAFAGANAIHNWRAGSEENWFALEAYAIGNNNESGFTADDTFGNFISYGVSKSDLTLHTDLDFTCTGSGIDKLIYCFEGDNVIMPNLSGREKGMYLWYTSSRTDLDDATTFGPIYSFSVDYNDQGKDKNNLFTRLFGTVNYYSLYMSLDSDDTVRQIVDDLDDAIDPTEKTQDELRKQLAVHVLELFAEQISKATLTITAKFTDGTAQTKRYSIAPVDDYLEVYEDYLGSDGYKGVGGKFEEGPSLFVITEISA